VSDAAEYAKYRVRVVAVPEDVRILPTWPRWLWRKLVRRGVGTETEYDGDRLRKRYGDQWAGELERWSGDHSLEILGSDNKREWMRLSTWRPTSGGASEVRSAALDSRGQVLNVMRVVIASADKEPSRGAAAWHLQRQGFVKGEIVRAMHELGWDDVNLRNLSSHLKYGKKLERDGVPCPFDGVR